MLDFGGSDAGLLSSAAVYPSGDAALPLGGSAPFIAAMPGTPFTLDLSHFAKLSSVAFIWGSVDLTPSYNVLTVIGKDNSILGTFTGLDVTALYPPGPVDFGSGDQNNSLSNPWVTLLFGADERTNIRSLVFSADQKSFEVSNLTLSLPEAGTWAMMIVGVGLAGGALRRRNKVVVRYS